MSENQNAPDLLKGNTILIAEDEMFIAYDIANCVADAGGEVLGPVATVADASQLLDRNDPTGAILRSARLYNHAYYSS